MKSRILVATALAALTFVAHAAVDVQFAQGSRPGTYHKVFIAVPTVEFQRAFLRNQAYAPRIERLTQADTEKLAREMRESFHGALGEAFKARGFEIATSPSPDALQLAPALREVYVNAPERSTTVNVKQYTREAGEATLVVEARDGAGKPVLSATDRLITTRTEDFQRATGVSNRFWFESMFRNWAEDLAAAIAGSR